MPPPADELRKIRLAKLARLIEKGLPPFGQLRISGRLKISQARQEDLGRSVTVAGRTRSFRRHGGLTFADLEDDSAAIQLSFGFEKLGGENYSLLELFDVGDFLLASGKLFRTTAGELTIEVAAFELLTKSLRSLPTSFYGLKDVEERYRQRYVDLWVNPEVRRVFKVRTAVIQALRAFLDAEGFLEVETPILQPLYGGATAKPFITHHHALGADFYLRISDELYLKRLVVGGLERVYELGKDFRNEGFDRQHNPEFTMLEFYWAYATYQSLMEFTERMLSSVVIKVLGEPRVSFEGKEINFTPPWPRLTFREALLGCSGLDVDEVKTEAELLSFIRQKGIGLDLAGVVGYAPILDTLYKKLVRPQLSGPLFLIDHPYAMKPLAKRKKEDASKAASFQLLAAGVELVNAYDELNDPLDQRRRFEEESALAGRGLSEYQVLDEDYLRALEYGMPPTAGWGLGIDRLVAILTNCHSIKETILFPTLRPEKQLTIDNGQLTKEQASSSQGLVPEPREGSNPIKAPVGLPLEPSGGYPSREKALEFVKEKNKNQNLFRHMLAVETAMKALARKLGGNEELWGVLGLLHDADWEETKTDYTRHTKVTLEWLGAQGYFDGPIVQALKSHNRKHTQLAEIGSTMEWALECVDELTGFIVSVALIKPDKKLVSVEIDSILKRWKEKRFAAAVDRTQIEQCEAKLGLKLPDFIGLTLTAMKGVAAEIGL